MAVCPDRLSALAMAHEGKSIGGAQSLGRRSGWKPAHSQSEVVALTTFGQPSFGFPLPATRAGRVLGRGGNAMLVLP